MTFPTALQAVILALKDNKLYPLTENTPTCLLPVGTQPLLHHMLKWLENASVTDITVVAAASGRSRIETYLARSAQFNPGNGQFNYEALSILTKVIHSKCRLIHNNLGQQTYNNRR